MTQVQIDLTAIIESLKANSMFTIYKNKVHECTFVSLEAIYNTVYVDNSPVEQLNLKVRVKFSDSHVEYRLLEDVYETKEALIDNL